MQSASFLHDGQENEKIGRKKKTKIERRKNLGRWPLPARKMIMYEVRISMWKKRERETIYTTANNNTHTHNHARLSVCVCVKMYRVSTYWLAGRRISIRLGPNGGPSVGSTRPTHAPSLRIGSLGRPRAPPVVSEIVKKKRRKQMKGHYNQCPHDNNMTNNNETQS
jgi:hypothetical protein